MVRSILSDANRRRPVAIFAETFSELARQADRTARKTGSDLVRLIDSSPIPLSSLHELQAFNGRIKGAKLHLVYDPGKDIPQEAVITPANVNDISFAHEIAVQPDTTYVFDKGYCSLQFWQKLHDAQAIFITRPKQNAALEVICPCGLDASTLTGTNVVSDEIVERGATPARRLHRQYLSVVRSHCFFKRVDFVPLTCSDSSDHGYFG
jgi:IS4 transposase